MDVLSSIGWEGDLPDVVEGTARKGSSEMKFSVFWSKTASV